MSECTGGRRHEYQCPHHSATSRWRWRAEDGCQGSVCAACFLPETEADIRPGFTYVGWWRDLVELTLVDRDGIPFGRKAWTQADALGDMLRGNRP